MHSLFTNVYDNSPVLLQNILVSLYGWKIDKIRHGKKYNDLFSMISRRYYFTLEELTQFQNKSLQQLIKVCAENVPYYRKLFHDRGISGDKIKTVDDLTMIPLLEKIELRNNAEDFIDEEYDQKKLLTIHTTGTTGTPLNIFCDSYVRQMNYAFYQRFLQHAGIDYRKKRATFGGRIVVPAFQRKKSFWRYSYFQKNMLFSSYHLHEETIELYIKKLFQYRPHYIDAYPSSIYIIAEYAQQHGISLKGITKGITTSAETLFDEHRMTIEKAFDVPVIDQYGTAEMCVFIGQCDSGSYHVHTDYAIIEFLKDDGSQAQPGDEAEVVCTGLINSIMPLLRYRIGDKVILSENKCECGSVFPVVEKVLGRADDFILTPEGNKVGRLSPVLKGFPVQEAQYIQKIQDAVLVRIVPGIGYCESIEQKITIELRKRLGQKIKIYFDKVDHLERGVGGKLKTIISRLS